MFSAANKSVSSGGYQVSNSLRFRASASAYLNRTPSVAGNQRTWTWSGWVKLGSSSSGNMYLLSANTASGFNDAFGLSFQSWSLNVSATSGGATTMSLQTTQVFRDFSSWYHLVIAVDTTQATAANRLKIYVNGVQVTALSGTTYPAQNASLQVNSNVPHYIGTLGYTYSVIFDGYMAEVNFIDGQALTPSSFGSINATTGVWQPARYTGSYGTNGFYLKFNNGTSTTTLGNDSSGNGNNWTTNNISLTAGSTYDWMIDSPTSYAGSSYGVGNYAVLNPLDLVSPSTLSAGNLNFDTGIAGGGGVNANWQFPLTGKFYFELYNLGNVAASNGRALCANTYWEGNTGDLYVGASLVANIGTYTSGDTLAWATDCAAQTIKIYKNNSLLYTASVGSAMYLSTVFSFRDGSGSNAITGSVNFGQMPFIYTPPTGFKSLCTQNLPAPAIYNGANHMAATTYTGTGSSLSISNSVNSASFQPDFVWFKSRSSTAYHALFDVVRGRAKGLSSNTTDAELTSVNAGDNLVSFNANGFTVGSVATSPYWNSVNGSALSLVAWQWKAGGTAVTNTSGTIISQVSANPTAGFSVVTYTGNGSLSATVGHGLGVAPSMIIQKSRSDGYYSWRVYHQSIAAGTMLLLNSTSAAIAINSDGGISSVGSSTFGFSGGTPAVNTTSATYVAYCFAAIAGYSAFGSYTGNGSSVGPFIYTGFLPRFILIKSTSGPRDWIIWDTARNPYNIGTAGVLFPDTSGAEYSGGGAYAVSVVSNGFYLPVSTTNLNASGETMIYAAFASNPFQNSLAF